VVENDFEKSFDYLKKYMMRSGLLQKETTKIIDVIVEKMRKNGIQGKN
jgi:DNA-binding ferritin-like protein (Dps family)